MDNQSTKQLGFTLIELMISLTLGLLVSAIALQLFLTSQRSATAQQGMMNLQNSTLFGLGEVINHLRIANLNASQPFIDDTVLYGGVVLTANNISANLTNFSIDAGLLTRGGIGPSNLHGVKSDQLVVQYKVNTPNQFDCEGTGLTLNDYVVERYFLRVDTNRNDPNSPLALACKATRYTEATAKTNTELSGLSTSGEIIIPRVDHFSVRLGVAYDGANDAANPNCTTVTTSITSGTPPVTETKNIAPDTRLDCFSYMDIETYRALTDKKPQIVSLQIGVLARSTDTVGNNQFFDADQDYNILNVNAKLKTHARNNLYLRDIVTQTIAIRNGFGIE
ncbi:PilW family protein [Acinetobacter beijerinckii]|uniref:PilW family protein n=1 Tax=Acinetobacter beijerinckii TaxID=262668 RepID=UPI003AF5F176